MNKFTVMLHSRGDRLSHGLIRKSYVMRAQDDVDAAMRAKEQAKQQFPERDSWIADHVEKVEAV